MLLRTDQNSRGLRISREIKLQRIDNDVVSSAMSCSAFAPAAQRWLVVSQHAVHETETFNAQGPSCLVGKNARNSQNSGVEGSRRKNFGTIRFESYRLVGDVHRQIHNALAAVRVKHFQ